MTQPEMIREDSPVVSIIIPCYQQEAYLADAINSALSQSHPSVEVVVVNDGSTDKSDQIARSFGNRITYIHKDNEGVSKTRNRGVKASQGEYLIFLDGDDLLDHRAVELHLSGMQKTTNRITVLGHQEFRTQPAIASKPTSAHFTLEDGLPKLIYGNYGPPVKFMCSRQSYDAAGGFQLESWGCEDWNLWANIAINGADIARSETVGAYYRRGEEMRTADYRAMLKSQCDHFRQIHDRLITDEVQRETWGEELLNAEQNMLRVLIAHRMPKPDIQQLSEQISDLNKRGISNPKSTSFRCLLYQWAGPATTERLTLLKWSFTDRSLWRHYRQQNRNPL